LDQPVSPPVTLVVPTVGRPSLGALLGALAEATGPLPAAVLLVDDRPGRPRRLDLAPPDRLASLTRVLRSSGRGPAAARNVGWRAATTQWVAFLDDDVLPPQDWWAALDADLSGLRSQVAGSQGAIVVPLPTQRRPTDWERNTAGLERAWWATADMAYRRTALAAVGGFDERFGRAYREDADLALRVMDAGFELVRGDRHVVHPVRPAGPWVSLGMQAGNAGDVLMRRVHGPSWRRRAVAPPGRRPRHLATTAAGLLAFSAGAARRRWPTLLAVTGWLIGTGELAWARIAPGPRVPAEVARMVATSVALPPLATWHWLRGLAAHRGAGRWPGRPAAVLFDRDGTLVRDVPYNGDPAKVEPLPGVDKALARVRAAGLPIGVVSNQSGVGRGLLTHDDVRRVNARVEDLLGPFDVWQICPHDPDDGCGCRKPAPGLVNAAAAQLGIPPWQCALVGDIGSDVAAAHAAGARAVLVPTDVTRPEEIADAPYVAADLPGAVDLLLGAEATASR
jgi:histidinol-phosphate phosphatase family protein